MRGQFDARQESHSSHTKPKEFSPEEQNHDADQRADNRNSEMRGVSALSGYDFKKIHACRGGRRGDDRYIYLLRARLRNYLIGLVRFEPTACRRADRSTVAY